MRPIAPLTALFRVAVATRNTLYDRGTWRARRLAGPVVSVGNLSVGGAGKTPFVILLGELLKARGIAFDVLSRGYGRMTKGTVLVDSAGSARAFGDEPLLISRKLGVPVIVGADRHRSGRFAEQRFGPQMHLLDDGFQHRALARDFDIVLLSPEDAHSALLPVGRLREPLTSLRRADAVVLAHDIDANLFPQLAAPRARQLVWRSRRAIAVDEDGRPQRPLAFCGIARPQRFFADLRGRGIVPVAELAFRDHHRYTSVDVDRLRRLQRQRGADGFITTEKDEMNLGPLLHHLGRVSVARVTLELLNANAALDAMLACVEQRRGG